MENFCSINFELLKCVKERTLDKKFKVRKEALLGFGRLYRHYVSTPAQLAVPDSESLSLIKNKLFHAYYPLSIESRILVERIFHTCLVPIQR
ncbi:Sister chromatid cohesion protein PDS5-like protein B-A, partial [Stegodyphus mimosarum]